MKAILTGHSRGLGAAIGAELLSRDIPVLALARGGNKHLQATFPQLLEQHEIDLSDSAALMDWLSDNVLQRFLGDCRQALLINNAAIVQPVGPMSVQDPATVARAVALNVTAPLMLSAAFAAASSGERRILHISSGAGRHPFPGWSIYCASKAALDHHARVAVLDKESGLRICSLAPGVIDTDMQTEIRATPIEHFPIREHFHALKRNNELSPPTDCARRLVDYLLAEQFGRNPVADLR